MKSLGFDDHPDIASSIGFAYAKLGNPGEARSLVQQGAGRRPQSHRHLVYSGALYVVQGDLTKRVGDLDRIKALCGAAACRESQELEGLIAPKGR